MPTPRTWQQVEQIAQALQHSKAATESMVAMEEGRSRVGPKAAKLLRDGLDSLCIDLNWAGLLLAYFDAYLGRPNPPSDEALIIHTLQNCLPFLNIISGGAVLDLSGPAIPPSLPLAMLRQDATLVLPVAEGEYAEWLRGCAAALGLENVEVVERPAQAFDEIISRDNRPLNDFVGTASSFLALGGRLYSLRHQLYEFEIQRLSPQAEFIQAISIPAPGLGAPRQILHLVASGVTGTYKPKPSAASFLLDAASQSLAAIEAEMKSIGYWSDNPPNLLALAESGELKSYLDAPSFELWLQCVFLPRARAAIAADDMPASSDVGGMAMRQYDYHSFVPEAQTLLQMLRSFDSLVAARAAMKLSGI